ncbi:B12-binding domain-containing radical SAM protein [Streptomyces sp. NPDC053474]|uniref:B12-binding domain-containing radical SAM protein n=1 Tax=Streptomyces sp. NPDC053474 TaxID=3365704 RepID=UPI0037D07953
MSSVCLVIPSNPFDRYFIQLPLDAVTAAGHLRAAGHCVTIWDQRLQDAPADPGPFDVLVVYSAIADRAQCYPLDLGPVRAAVERAVARFPAARTVAVGPHGTQLPESTRADLAVDHVAVGETDSATVGAVADLLAGVDDRILCDRSSPHNLLDSPAPRPKPYPALPLDSSPFPAFDLVPTADYTAEVISGGLPLPGPCGMVLAARGCTYGCTYCHLPFGTRMRTQPLDRVVAEIDAQQEAGLKFVFFLDYVFGINRTFYGELCRRLEGRDLGWVGQTRAEMVLKSDVTQWARAGCQGMWLGAESPAVADTGVHKRVTEEQIKQAVLKLRDAGIVPFAFVLMGLPGDEACISGRLVDWAADLPAWFGINQLFLRPGTTLYDQLAPAHNGGRTPTTWREVEEVTRHYRATYPTDLDAQQQRLTALPNFLGNSIVPTAG